MQELLTVLVYLNLGCGVAAERPGRQKEEDQEEEGEGETTTAVQYCINFVRSQTEGINK